LYIVVPVSEKNEEFEIVVDEKHTKNEIAPSSLSHSAMGDEDVGAERLKRSTWDSQGLHYDVRLIINQAAGQTFPTSEEVADDGKP
jgi:hypothetical protein